MGFRTTIILNNDFMHEIQTAPNFGQLVYEAGVNFYVKEDGGSIGRFGEVVDVSHADTTKLGILGPKGAFSFQTLSTSYWNASDPELGLLREAADKLGYRLVKKPESKVPFEPLTSKLK